MTGQIVVELSSAYRARAVRLRLKARVLDVVNAQSLLLLAEDYDCRAVRLERLRAQMRGAVSPVAESSATGPHAAATLVLVPSLAE